jgi:hypothetical protein
MMPSTTRTANEASQAIVFGAAQFIMCTFASTMYNPNIENILMVAEFNPVAIISAGIARIAMASAIALAWFNPLTHERYARIRRLRSQH